MSAASPLVPRCSCPRPPGDEARGVARVPLLSDAEAWKALPPATRGAGQPLPGWARAFARSLPRTTAAMLDLDRLPRTRSPLGPLLRGKMRWVAADANRCAYGRATAEADLRRAGLDEAGVEALKGTLAGSPRRRACRTGVRPADDARGRMVTDDEVGPA